MNRLENCRTGESSISALVRLILAKLPRWRVYVPYSLLVTSLLLLLNNIYVDREEAQLHVYKPRLPAA